MITPQSILHHELIGLYAVVVWSRNKTQEGMWGIIIDETKNTLSLRTENGIKCLEKQHILLRVTLPDSVDVVIDCSCLSVAPARRVTMRVR
ncbi:MAG: ribonuclease P protein subunit [Methanocalculaceae archaeon]|nr:ribonuclease P protein subunit [Methanocalculaceae archaeon]